MEVMHLDACTDPAVDKSLSSAAVYDWSETSELLSPSVLRRRTCGLCAMTAMWHTTHLYLTINVEILQSSTD